LFNSLADKYEEHFSVPHRKMYDDIAWEYVCTLLPAKPSLIVDSGCGIGRWASRFIKMGHRVIGIEQAPKMIEKVKSRNLGKSFSLIEGSMEKVQIEAGTADLVFAMGSLQYTEDPGEMIKRFSQWTRVDGYVCILVDSQVGLAIELLVAGKFEESLKGLDKQMGKWTQQGLSADLHHLDSKTLTAYFEKADLTEIQTRGLLVSFNAFGKERFFSELNERYDGIYDLERKLFKKAALADSGKHILVSGQKKLKQQAN